jgi:hypothetical protein
MSPTITTCWFTFWGTEIVALTGIKVSKVFKNSASAVHDVGIFNDGTNE